MSSIVLISDPALSDSNPRIGIEMELRILTFLIVLVSLYRMQRAPEVRGANFWVHDRGRQGIIIIS